MAMETPMSVDDIIRDVADESDIAFSSDLYQEVACELSDIGLNLAFFVFTSRKHSSCARTLNGETESYPVITLYLRYDADLQQTGIERGRKKGRS
jgi:hypothetical protein